MSIHRSPGIVVIPARDLHPSILGGLIPVDQPCFIDKDGNTSRCRSVKVNVEMDWDQFHEPYESFVHHLPLVCKCVKKAQEEKATYMLGISIQELYNTSEDSTESGMFHEVTVKIA